MNNTDQHMKEMKVLTSEEARQIEGGCHIIIRPIHRPFIRPIWKYKLPVIRINQL